MSVKLDNEEIFEIIKLMTDTEKKLGRYSMDPEQHAWNTIEDAAERATRVKEILDKAIERIEQEA